MREFITDVSREVEEAEELVFKHDDREVVFIEPSSGQMAIMATVSTTREDAQTMQTIMQFMFSIMAEDTLEYFRDRLLDRNDPFEMDGDGGLIDIFEAVMEEWSGKATKQPSDYQPPRKSTGRSSTGSSQGKGRTSSSSRSRASSTSSNRGS